MTTSNEMTMKNWPTHGPCEKQAALERKVLEYAKKWDGENFYKLELVTAINRLVEHEKSLEGENT